MDAQSARLLSAGDSEEPLSEDHAMRFIIIAALVLHPATVSFAVDTTDNTPVGFTRDIAPIFSAYCVGCHNDQDREGELSLESFRSMAQGGEHGPVIVARKADASRVLQVLVGTAKPKMPPEDNEAPSAAQIERIRAWINSGAVAPTADEEAAAMLHTPQIPPADVPAPVTSVAWSPDGSTIAIARFGEVELMNAETRFVVRRLSGFPGKVNSVRFSADGSKLLTASGIAGVSGQAAVFDVASGEALLTINGHRDTLYAVSITRDDAVMATAGYDRRIMLWDAHTGDRLRTLEGHNDAIYDLAFHPDGTILASASGDETVKLWQTSTGMRLDTLGQPLAEQYVVRFSPDGRQVIAGGADNRIRVWDLTSRHNPDINPLRFARFAHEGAVVGLEFSRTGNVLVSVAEDRSMKVWETEHYTQTFDYDPQDDVVSAVAMSPTAESMFVGRLDGSTRFLPVRNARPAVVAVDSVTPAGVMPDADGDLHSVEEHEPNNRPDTAQRLDLPTVVRGTINPADGQTDADSDIFRFASRAGEQWVLETNAARMKSPVDTQIEVLSPDGEPVPRVVLQAVRDSYFTFRGKDSTTIDDFRVQNWQEMELNEYLYCNGEVVKLWLYPRGPDSGFKVYPGTGSRYGFFDTTNTTHALHAPTFIVEPHSPGTPLIPNGLPKFTIYFENDDDSLRRFDSDSFLTFTAPADGDYLVRVTDSRGFHGSDFQYELTIRPRRPDFKVTLSGANPTVSAGSGREFSVNAERIDGFDDPIEVHIDGLPPGFQATTPVIIEAGQLMAFGLIHATTDAAAPLADNAKTSRVIAQATIDGRAVVHDTNNFGEIKLGKPPQVTVRLQASSATANDPASTSSPLELTIHPGETISARVVVDRNNFTDRIDLGKDDAGRNLPHGVFVDNIGLNGLLIVEDQSEREFFITAARWVPETTRLFHLKANVDGGQTSLPVLLHVRHE